MNRLLAVCASSRLPAPEFLTIWQNPLYRAKIFTAITWLRMRPQFEPAQLRMRLQLELANQNRDQQASPLINCEGAYSDSMSMFIFRSCPQAASASGPRAKKPSQLRRRSSFFDQYNLWHSSEVTKLLVIAGFAVARH